jgi:tetratricopeptide (TPR) repeat protein
MRKLFTAPLRLLVLASLVLAVMHGVARAQTASPEALAAFREGQELYLNRNYERLPLAIERFEAAVALDDSYGQAWAALAMAYALAPHWAITDRDYHELAASAAARALALDPLNADALVTLGNLAGESGDYLQVMDYLGRAVEADPAHIPARLFQGDALRMLGYFERAGEEYAACLALDPAFVRCLHRRAAIIREADASGDYRAALSGLLESRFSDVLPEFMGVVAQEEGGIALRALLRDYVRIFPVDARWLVGPMARALSGEDYDRMAALEEVEARLIADGFDPDSDDYLTMTYRLAFGAYDQVPVNFALPWYWYRGYSGLEGSDAQRAAIIRFGLPDYWRAHGFPDRCEPVGDDDFVCE